MAQPIKKRIQEVHPEMIQEKPFRTLLIDGNSLLFSCMADPKVNSEGLHYGGIFQFLLQIRMMITKGEFEYIYVFFDNEFSGVLRWQIYPYYKQNRDKHYEDYGLSDYMKQVNAKVRSMAAYFDAKNKKKKQEKGDEEREYIDKFKSNSISEKELIELFGEKYGKRIVRLAKEEILDENFDRERNILCRYFNELYIRWNIDETTEGDDQIAYYCMHKKPNERIVIMSADMDLAQLLSDDICIYNQKEGLKKFITNKNFYENFGYDYRNVLVKKIFTGDSSDNIGNIKGLSEDGFFKLMPEAKKRAITVEEVKEKAKKLIDERIAEKKKPLKLHENIVNGVSNKEYGGNFYEINEKIIDLKHPLLSPEAKETMDAMMYAPQDPEGRSFKNLYQYIVEDDIDELTGDTRFASFLAPFKSFAEREIKRFEESKKN
jgi:5'-3' exonuclease